METQVVKTASVGILTFFPLSRKLIEWKPKNLPPAHTKQLTFLLVGN